MHNNPKTMNFYFLRALCVFCGKCIFFMKPSVQLKTLFMQNEPNLARRRQVVSDFIVKGYGILQLSEGKKNKANQSQ